jgi:signal transduction histidine kinase
MRQSPPVGVPRFFRTEACASTPEARPGRAAVIFAGIVLLGGVCVLAGWHFRIPVLKGAFLGTVIAPNTGLLLILAAVSVLLQLLPHRVLQSFGIVMGVLVACFAAAILSEHLTGRDLGIDRLFLSSSLNDWRLGSPKGRVAAPTTMAFAFAGIRLLLLRWPKPSGIVDVPSAMVLTISYLAMVGYLYGVRPLYGYVMALPTAFLLLFTGCMLVASAKRSWLRETLLSRDAGGMLLRRMGPTAIILFPLLGWMQLRAQSAGLIPLELATAIFVVTLVLLFAAGALHTAAALNQVDAERKQVQAALIRTEKLATAGRLAATVAHEINNPLSAALNAVFIAKTNCPEDLRDQMDMADRELKRVAAVVRQSLGFYRGSGKPQPVVVSELIGEVVGLFRSSAVARGIELREANDDNASIVVEPGELRQIISNLVANALDATSQGSVVVGTRTTPTKQVELYVRDTGHGIPAQVMDQIFEPFFTTKENYGTGLGLFVVKDLVAKNGGVIAVESYTEGSEHGTTFTLSFPLLQASGSSERDNAASRSANGRWKRATG